MLDGVTVVDLTQQLPGPYAAMLLRGLGARTIKVEPPGGDPARQLDPWMFRTLNGGAASLVLNLKSDAGQEVLGRLARDADIVLEGFRPDVADRIGAGYARLSGINPRLVYVSVSGYGRSGPYRDLPGHDLNYLGVAGGLARNGRVQETPSEGAPVGIPTIDLAAGTTAAFMAAGGLYQRAITGRGCLVDVAMVDVAVFWSSIKSGGVLGAGASDRRPPEAGEPTYGVFRCADGAPVTVALLEDRFWRAMCGALGWDDWRDAPDLASYQERKAQAARIRARLANTLGTRPRAEWLERFRTHDVPAAPAHSLVEATADPHLRARALWQADGKRGWRPAPPIPAEHRRMAEDESVPEPGSAREAVLTALGYTDVEMRDLASGGAFG